MVTVRVSDRVTVMVTVAPVKVVIWVEGRVSVRVVIWVEGRVSVRVVIWAGIHVSEVVFEPIRKRKLCRALEDALVVIVAASIICWVSTRTALSGARRSYLAPRHQTEGRSRSFGAPEGTRVRARLKTRSFGAPEGTRVRARLRIRSFGAPAGCTMGQDEGLDNEPRT